LNPFTRVRTFYKETTAELKKATWPDFAELRGSTAVVVVGVFILGLFISVADFSLSNWIEYATHLLRN
jgi:preprotein translocase subunit SecE